MNFTPSPRSYNFVNSLEFVLPWETGRPKKGEASVRFGKIILPADGGLHYHDSGVATKWGIHQRANPDLDVANLSLDDAVEVYKERYWLPYLLDMKPVYVDLDEANTALAISTFDGGVNCGVGRMMIWFKRSIKEKDPTKAINNLRRAYYYEIVSKNPEVHQKNLNGWLRRLNDLNKLVDIIKASPTP